MKTIYYSPTKRTMVTVHPIGRRRLYLAGFLVCPHGPAALSRCQERDERIVTLERRIAELEANVHDLTVCLGTNATNSGTPPSANPSPSAKHPPAKNQAHSRDIPHA
jgi:hypothetical protein